MAIGLQDIQRKVSHGEPLSQEERGALVRISSSGRNARPMAPEGGDGGGMGVGSAPESAGISTGTAPESMSPESAGMLGRGVSTGVGLTGITSGVPGAAGAAGGLISDVAAGKDATTAATNAAGRIGLGYAGKALADAGMPTGLVGYGLNTAMGLISEMQKNNPNYGYAVAKGIPSTLGAIAGAPLGPLGSLVFSTVASHFGTASFEEGYLGDYFDVRSYEQLRDVAEDMGYSVGDTSEMAAMDEGYGKMGIDPGEMGTSFETETGFETDVGFGLETATKDAPLAPETVSPDFWGESTPISDIDSIGTGDGMGTGGVSGTDSIGDQTSAGFDDDSGMSDAEGLA